MKERHCTIIQKGTGYIVGHLKGNDLVINRDMFSDNELEAILVDVEDHKCIYCNG